MGEREDSQDMTLNHGLAVGRHSAAAPRETPQQDRAAPPPDPAVVHGATHGDYAARIGYSDLVDRIYERGGVTPFEGPVECEECRRIAQWRVAVFMGQLIHGTGAFGNG